jgi:hypothetical protein
MNARAKRIAAGDWVGKAVRSAIGSMDAEIIAVTS